MMPEEDVVPLVVEGDAALSPELGVVVKDGRQHPAHRVSQPRREVIEDNLRPVLRDLAPVLSAFCSSCPSLPANLDVAELEVRRRTFCEGFKFVGFGSYFGISIQDIQWEGFISAVCWGV